MSEGPTVASSGPGIVVVQVRGGGALGIRDSECPHYSKTCTSGFDKYLRICAKVIKANNWLDIA